MFVPIQHFKASFPRITLGTEKQYNCHHSEFRLPHSEILDCALNYRRSETTRLINTNTGEAESLINFQQSHMSPYTGPSLSKFKAMTKAPPVTSH